MAQRGEHAIVLGGSMAGLLAARVLSEFYRTVTVVERDVFTDEPSNRRGVPQGRLAHAVLARGSQIIDELFPGFLDDLASNGVPVWDGRDFSKFHLSIGGHRLGPVDVPNPLPMSVNFPSRPYLEWKVRRRVRDIPNVTMRDGHDVAGLTTTTDAPAGSPPALCQVGPARSPSSASQSGAPAVVNWAA